MTCKNATLIVISSLPSVYHKHILYKKYTFNNFLNIFIILLYLKHEKKFIKAFFEKPYMLYLNIRFTVYFLKIFILFLHLKHEKKFIKAFYAKTSRLYLDICFTVFTLQRCQSFIYLLTIIYVLLLTLYKVRSEYNFLKPGQSVW